MSDFFKEQSIQTTQKSFKKSASDFFDPIVGGIYNDRNRKEYDLIFVLDKIVPSGFNPARKSKEELQAYQKFFLDEFEHYVQTILDKKFPLKRLNCLFLSVVPYYLEKDDDKRAVTLFYAKNSVDLTKYIPPFSKVITVGRALYAITRSDDIDIQTFWDHNFREGGKSFNKNWFFDPRTQSYVFPISSFEGKIAVRKEDTKSTLEKGEIFTPKSWKLNDEIWCPPSFDNYFASNQIVNAVKHQFSNNSVPVIEKIRIGKGEVVEKLKKWSQHNLPVAWDIETTGPDPFIDRVIALTLSFNGMKAYYLPFSYEDVPYYKEFFRNRFQIGANLKFDIEFTRIAGITTTKVDFDVISAGHILNENRRNSLKSLTWIYLKYGGYDYELDEYRRKHPDCKSNFSLIPKNMLFEYATMDAVVTFQLWKSLEREINRHDLILRALGNESLHNYFYNVRIPATNLFVDLELRGMVVDWDRVRGVSKELESSIHSLKEEIYRELGQEINEQIVDLKSNKQLGIFLEEYLQWPEIERSQKERKDYKLVVKYHKLRGEQIMSLSSKEKGVYLTNEKCLVRWSQLGEKYKIAKKILTFRELSTLQNTFIGYEKGKNGKPTGIWQYRKPDGRIHSNFMVMMATSHRNKSRNPNLQNIPKHGEWAEKIRSIFTVPSSDYLLGEIDYSGFQLRIATIMSKDPMMLHIFKHLNGDMHSITGQAVFQQEIAIDDFLKHKKDKYKEDRFKAKAINFGFIFGASAFAFMKNVLEKEWSRSDCITYIQKNKLMEEVTSKKMMIEDAESEFIDSISPSHDKDEILRTAQYLVVAEYIRDKFFDQYTGLLDMIQNQILFAEGHGFIQSVFGPVRRLPELAYYKPFTRYKSYMRKKGKEPIDGRFRKWISRKSMNSYPTVNMAHLKHLQNTAVNAPVQAFEVVAMMISMIEVEKGIKEKALDSYFMGMVHDSNMQYVKRGEEDIMIKILKECSERPRKEYEDLSMLIDASIGNPLSPDNQYWGSELAKEWEFKFV